MKKGSLMRITAVFFVFMLCFTILSRAADQMGIAVVSVERPQNRMIEHVVRTAGKIVQNQDLAVTTQPNQRVMAIYVREGDRVAKGDLLFEIDMTLLEEEILGQQQEMEKQQLQVKDVKSQKAVSAEQKANVQAQAQEQYSLSTRRADVALSRAKQQLEQAKQDLEDFKKSNGVTQKDSSVEEALLKTFEEKANAYAAAQQELSTLQWEIENAVYIAKQNADNRASLIQENMIFTQSADIVEIEAGQLGDIILPEDSVNIDSILDVTGAEGSADIWMEDSSQLQNDNALVIEDVQEEILPETSETAPEMSQPEMPEIILPETSQEMPKPLTQEELDQIEQSVRQSYDKKLAEARKKVEDAKKEQEAAEAAYMQYQQEQMSASNSENAQTGQQLIANVQAAQQAYQDAAIAANEAAVTSGRAVQIAGIPDASNSSDRMNEITYEQMELSLQKLENLKAANGKIYADAEGLVTKINIMTGEKTTDTTAILMADLSKGYRFTADITKEQQKYIGTGDMVTLTSGDGKKKLEELPVLSVAEDEENENIYHVTVQVPKDTFEIGMNVSMDFSRKSEAYSVTVPLSALHLDEKKHAYVLVPEEYESIMGKETRARRIDVTVLDQNESFAALAEGTLSSQQEIIAGSDKAVDDGSRVRVGT